MTPEEVVLQLKKNGTFDDLRKRLLTEFQNGGEGQKFLGKLELFMEDMVARNPSLVEKDSLFFHDQVSVELEKAGVYNAVRQDVLATLKEEYYQQRVDKEIQTVNQKEENN
ncbi:hypothetical protein MAM1_0283c09211 [Mucor ambiguus]|uniref:BOD1/SHG1 domain-containing protein n=1 Tax=Mucor ambiguus TaxID=91626 RepID=A0A0C9MQE8_9FUNG|nr:hypothetical protein MAM1_0283c09211 [Mucor ambiguus]